MTLAEARNQAGLTVADVSASTRIREGLIRAIEQDEFAPCGGDFYARGHIRAIAAVVGADSAALISEYDAARLPPPLQEMMEEEPEPPPRPPRRSGRGWGPLVPVVMVLFLVGVVLLAYRLTAGGGGSPSPGAASTGHPAARTPAASHAPRPSPSNASPAVSASPSPPAVQVTSLTPVSAAAYGPGGTTDGDNAQNASLALSGNPATPWHTDWYATARFGNLQNGTGLLLDLGKTVTATGVTIRLGDTHGADLQVRAGDSTTDLHVVASAADAGGAVRLQIASQPHIRYMLLWFTLLPPDQAGTYMAQVSSVKVAASAAA